MNLINKKGFTMMEVVVVGIILALFIAFVVPSFDTYSEKAKIRDAVNILYVMGGAQKIYKVKTGHDYLATSDLATINSVLNLNIQNTDWQFATDSNGVCVAQRVDGPNIEISMAIDGKIICHSLDRHKYCDQIAN